MKNKTLFVFIVFNLIRLTSNSQILISQGGTVTVNGGETFYDAGGAAGNDGNTDYTITLAPATSGDRVCVDFTYFKTNFMLNLFGANEEDALFIYDGSTATGNDIGKLMGDYTAKTNGGTTPIRAGMAATASNAAVFTPTLFCATNAAGTLTFKFDNTSSPQYPGWEGNVITYTPNDNVGCNIALTADQTSICAGQTVNLTATGALVSAALNNNFNNSTVGTGWAASSSASFTNSACSAPSIDGSTYLWMQSAAAPRELKTNTMDVSNGGTISFEYRQAKYNSDGSPCEAPDIGSGTTNEGIYVQYSTNGGTSWNTFKYLFSHSLLSNSGTADLYNNGCGEYVTRWTKMTYPIPAAAQTASTQFRWVQPVATSASTDNWGLDNVVIASPKTTTITIKNLATGAIIGTSSSSPYSISVSPTVTTTYEATISDGTISCTSQITITVGNGTTPTFTQVATICSGAILAALPTTSNNAINGTWAPALNNTATTTYTFTPTSGQCAVNTTMTVAVNNSTTPTFTQVAAICSGATLAALPTTSNNAINGTWAPALNNTTTTTYTFTPNTAQCAVSTVMTINVNSSTTPIFTQVSAICSGETLTALPTTSNNAFNGTWAPALNNTATTTYTFTPTAGQCATNTTMTIAVNNSTTPTFTQVATICSGETLASLPTTSDNAINGTWTPALDNTVTTTYTFTPAAGQCAITTTMTVTINNSTIPTFTQVVPICSGTPLSALPIVSINNINGVWSPALNNIATTTYTFVPNNGQCAVNATMTITVNNTPVIQITDPSPVCEPLTVDLTTATITNGSTQGGNFSYWVNSNTSIPITNATAITTSGTYYIQNSVLGCSSIAPVTVIVYSQPIASFTTSFSSISEDNPSCSMINASIGGTTYNWSFGDGQTSSLENPTNTYTITENDVAFEITLTVVSEFGCIDSTKLVLPVEEELIYYIPNSFTPADSRYNQTFNPIFTSGYDADTYQLYIFDRWGTIVFQTKDALEGWDGLHPKTKTLVSDGVYTWKIAFNLKNSGERKEIYGHVNLLK